MENKSVTTFDNHPKKFNWVIRSREIVDRWATKYLPLPKINPHFVSFASVVLSFLFLLGCYLNLRYKLFWGTACLLFILMLDWSDGLIARKYNLVSKEGWAIDVVADRISEGLIFLAIYSNSWFYIWFSLWLINNLLSIISYLTKKHISLPLRWSFLIYFILLFYFNSWLSLWISLFSITIIISIISIISYYLLLKNGRSTT